MMWSLSHSSMIKGEWQPGNIFVFIVQRLCSNETWSYSESLYECSKLQLKGYSTFSASNWSQLISDVQKDTNFQNIKYFFKIACCQRHKIKPKVIIYICQVLKSLFFFNTPIVGLKNSSFIFCCSHDFLLKYHIWNYSFLVPPNQSLLKNLYYSSLNLIKIYRNEQTLMYFYMKPISSYAKTMGIGR